MRPRKKSYIIKDYWTHRERKHKEEEILSRIKGLLGVPQLVEAWTVQCNNMDVTTNWLRLPFLVTNIEFKTCIH
ncbi:hypothetical protein JVU11DRAFT_6263 [Chiua virens]|nr:hypothetical protein JVU11DRAFT_6263 [Chiua virens]